MFHGGSTFENFQKIKKVSKFLKCPKSFPKVSKRVLNVFWGKLFEKFLPSFPWNVESLKIFKEKNFQNSKNAQKCSQKYPNVFRVIFSKKFYAQCSMEGRVSKIFKIFFSKFQKCPKSFPKVSKRVLNVFWGKLFENFLPSFPWKVESSKIFKKIKKVSNFLKCTKSFPKVSKRVLNKFWGKLFEKFLPSVPWRVEFSKIFKKNIFQIPKMPKIVAKSIQTCFERALGQTFRKIFAQFSMEGRVFENFQRNQKICKIPKMPKIVPKNIQTCFERVLGQTFRKNYAQFSMEGRVFENFQRKNFSKFQKKPKSVPKGIQTCFRVIFSKKNLCPVFHGGSSFENFQIFHSKIEKCPKSFPKVSKRVLNVFWGKLFENFLPSFPRRFEF